MMKYLFRIAIILLTAFSFPCMAQMPNRTNAGSGMLNDRMAIKDLTNICESAASYRSATRQFGGGQGSYAGYTLPKNLAFTETGDYSVYEALQDTLIICVNKGFVVLSRLCIIGADGKIKNQLNAYDYEMNKIGKMAYCYFLRPASEGGGQYSYVGFKIPVDNESSVFGRYSIAEIKPEEITIQVYVPVTRMTFKATYNSRGRRYMDDDIMHELPAIQNLASHYRSTSISSGGGGRSYVGFTLPINLDSNEYGCYSLIDVQPDQFFLKAQPRNPRNPLIFIIDSAGGYRFAPSLPTNIDSSFARNYENIIVGLSNIGKSAVTYWKKTKPTNDMPGSFEGFVIPDSLADTKNGKYVITDIHNDLLHVGATPKGISHTEYFSIDASGNELYLNPSSYNQPRTMPNREEAFLNYKTAEAKLNDTYKKLLDKNKSDAQSTKNIRNSERLWIKFRDAQLIEKYNQDVSIENISKLTASQLVFLTILTDKRLKELQELIEQ